MSKIRICLICNKEFAKYPDLRYNLENGQTLCQIHHSEVHGRPIPNIGSIKK